MPVTDFSRILLVSDMDGTLLDGQSRISQENRAALAYFAAHGGLFTIATGRMERSVEAYLPLLPVNVPTVLYNGAVIYDTAARRRLFEVSLADSVHVQAVLRTLVGQFPELGIEVYHGEHIYFLQRNDETEKHKAKEGFISGLTPLEQIPKPWTKVLLSWEPAKLATVEAALPRRPELFRTVYSEPQFLELLPPGVSKGAALRRLIRLMGRTDLTLVCIGDNPNDQEMIETADLGIAVANAHPALKAAADLVTVHHDAHALAEVVTYLQNASGPWVDREEMQLFRRDA